MILLQTQVVQQSSKVLLDYGALGAVLLLALVGLVYQQRLFVKQSQKQDERITALSNQLNQYISEDRSKMMKVIENNTEAFNQLRFELHNK